MLLTLLASTPAIGDSRFGGTGRVEAPGGACVSSSQYQTAREATAARRKQLPGNAAAPTGTAAYPKYGWPLDRHLHDGLLVVNYVDDDSTAGLLDYMGGTHTYDQHAGIDYTLYNFRLMDRGTRVRAAAPGTVIYMSAPSPFDHHCDFDWPDDGNWIWVDNGDGTYSEYYHLRSNSVTVQLGDAVQRGELLGLVGSSGYATGPHLHFETGDDFSGPYRPRDPYTGPSNPLPSLWNAQEGYAGADHLWFPDCGVYTEAEVRGSIFNTSYCDLQTGIPQPVTYGATETRLCMWFQFQGLPNDSATIEVRRPDNSVYGSFVFDVVDKTQFGWFWAWYWWNGAITPADYGTWNVRMIVGGTLVRQCPFQVAAATVYPPRLWPRAGRSFRINGSVQRDTLRLHPLSPTATFSLLNAPGFVSLADSIVTVATTSTQATRSLYFQVVAAGAGARRDTAWYHVVDFSKAVDPLLDAPSPPLISGAGLELSLDSANPAFGPVRLRYHAPGASPVRLALYDVTGRRVRVLVEPHETKASGPGAATWDGRDDGGHAAPAGIYVARLEAGGRAVTLRLARMR